MYFLKSKTYRYLFLSCLFTSFISVGLFFSSGALAASCSGVDTAILDCEEGGTGGIHHVLLLILDIMAIGVGVLAVLGIVWVGIIYLTAGDDISRATKAKRRFFEIIIGVVCYAAIYGVTGWLLPDTDDTVADDNTKVSSLSISYSGKTYVDNTFVPTVTFNEDAVNKTYSLKSSNNNIVRTSGRGAVCLSAGKTSIEAISANGKKASMPINCEEAPITVSSSNNNENSSSSSSSTTYTERTTGSMTHVNLNGKPNMRKETRKIINDHRKDFYYYNYQSKVGPKKYKKYVQSLGGVFTKYASKTDKSGGIKKIKIKTAADFQEAAEYVFGLWTIWGPDYINGYSGYHPWRGDDAFYYGLHNRSTASWKSYSDDNINTLLSSSAKVYTGCNPSVNTFYKSTNLKSIGGASLHAEKHLAMSKVGKITNIKKLQVGDVVHFFNSNGSWRHVAMVGEVYKDYVVLYDGGSRFMNNRTYKHTLNRINGRRLSGSYTSYASWWAFRPWDIDQSVTLKGIN